MQLPKKKKKCDESKRFMDENITFLQDDGFMI